MSSTSDLNIISIQMSAVDQMRDDIATGAYAANIASDAKYYLQLGDQQTIPVGLDGNPEQFVALLRSSLPEVNTLRLCFNEFSFNPDGSMHPQFERFLEAAAQAGLKLIIGYSSGDVQRLGHHGGLSVDEFRDALSGRVLDTMEQSWDKMLDWVKARPAVSDAIYGLEIANEPASYDRAEQLAGNTGEFVRMYADHMLAMGALIDERIDARILVGGWAYSNAFDIFANTAHGDGTVLDALRAGLGADLVWSSHVYPGWLNEQIRTVGQFETTFQAIWGALGDDDIILTETNAPGRHADDPTIRDTAFDMVRAYELIADRGIGVGWFQGLEAGSSSLAVIDAAGRGGVRFLHPNSLAHALNIYSLDETDPALAGNDNLTAVLSPGRVRHEVTLQLMAVDGIATSFGRDGNDTLTGLQRAVNMLYGGNGNDSLIGREQNDHLFGQAGDDILIDGAGDDVLMGGRGNDTLYAQAGNDTLTGGDGADVFRISARNTFITDFSHAQNDQLYLNGVLTGGARLESMGVLHDIDGDGAVDDLVVLSGTQTLTLIDYRNVLPDGVVRGTWGADFINANYVDVDRDRTDWRGSVIMAGAGNDRAEGRSGNDTLHGEDGADLLDGMSGNDRLLGNAGNDTLLGNGGDDWLDGGQGADRLDGGWGDDTLYGGAGNDFLEGRMGADRIFGGEGNDTIFGGQDNGTWASGNGYDAIQAGLNILDGGNGDDRIYGGRESDTLRGGAGNDFLAGDNGHDRLLGQAGNDRMLGGLGNDLLMGGIGNDTLEGGRGSDTIYGGDGQDTIITAPGGGLVSHIYGEGGADSFVFQVGTADGTAMAVIYDFNQAEDRLIVQGIGNLDQVLDSDQLRWVRQVGADVHLNVAGDRIVLADTSLDMLL